MTNYQSDRKPRPYPGPEMNPIKVQILQALVELGGSGTVYDLKARTGLATMVLNPLLRGLLNNKARPCVRTESEVRDLRIGDVVRPQRQTVWYITTAGRELVSARTPREEDALAVAEVRA